MKSSPEYEVLVLGDNIKKRELLGTTSGLFSTKTNKSVKVGPVVLYDIDQYEAHKIGTIPNFFICCEYEIESKIAIDKIAIGHVENKFIYLIGASASVRGEVKEYATNKGFKNFLESKLVDYKPLEILQGTAPDKLIPTSTNLATSAVAPSASNKGYDTSKLTILVMGGSGKTKANMLGNSNIFSSTPKNERKFSSVVMHSPHVTKQHELTVRDYEQLTSEDSKKQAIMTSNAFVVCYDAKEDGNYTKVTRNLADIAAAKGSSCNKIPVVLVGKKGEEYGESLKSHAIDMGLDTVSFAEASDQTLIKLVKDYEKNHGKPPARGVSNTQSSQAKTEISGDDWSDIESVEAVESQILIDNAIKSTLETASQEIFNLRPVDVDTPERQEALKAKYSVEWLSDAVHEQTALLPEMAYIETCIAKLQEQVDQRIKELIATVPEESEGDALTTHLRL